MLIYIMVHLFKDYNDCIQKQVCDCSQLFKTANRSSAQLTLTKMTQDNCNQQQLIQDSPALKDVIQNIIKLQDRSPILYK